MENIKTICANLLPSRERCNPYEVQEWLHLTAYFVSNTVTPLEPKLSPTSYTSSQPPIPSLSQASNVPVTHSDHWILPSALTRDALILYGTLTQCVNGTDHSISRCYTEHCAHVQHSPARSHTNRMTQDVGSNASLSAIERHQLSIVPRKTFNTQSASSGVWGRACPYLYTSLYGVTTRNPGVLLSTTVRPSNLDFSVCFIA
jgi:hypothetical protein